MSMELINRITTDGSQQTIDFGNIPQIYSDLKMVASVRNTSTSTQQFYITINGSGGAGPTIANTYLVGTGTASGTFASTGAAALWEVGYQDGTSTANTYANIEFYAPDYRNGIAKSFIVDSVGENIGSAARQNLSAHYLSLTAPVTSVQIISAGNNFSANSTVSLYGINRQSGIGKPKAIGGEITLADGHWVHTFTGSGTFSPLQDLTCDYLVVAGGGSAGISTSGTDTGGGGAGGLRTSLGSVSGGGGALEPKILVTAGSSYPVTVGAGGVSSNGGNSTFSTITSLGGGIGAGNSASAVGGSGGGAGSANGTGSAGTTGQGYAGGNYVTDAGGGGGAGGPGVNNGGAGGIGLLSTITGSSVYYAGGGGGGDDSTVNAGGLGGGGASATSGLATAGAANTGGGGGGRGSSSSPAGVASGGSGIVIIRYPAE